ncbi:hypothetical protein ACJMK2_017201 [Sinanodonta woodiana]|uniref:Uncharacterized protein n=1 Tax=Sinanodonta woodiana TaxID=1069815 RepID=A0ABD3UZA8_SINWO
MLSSSKKKFIETWQKEVSQNMKAGNICRVVVAPITPDHGDDSVITKNESKLKELLEKPDSMNWAFRSNQNKKDSNDKFPVSYTEKCISNNVSMITNERNSNGSRRSDRTYLSGDPAIVDDHLYDKYLKIRQSNELKTYKRQSMQTAKTIYEKYASIDPNYLDTQINPYRTPPTLLSQIPWRTKTLLDLPFRFSNSGGHYASFDLHRSRNQFGTHHSNYTGRGIGSISNDSIDPRPVSGENSFFY